MKLIHTSVTNSLAIRLQTISPVMISALVSGQVSLFAVARTVVLSFTIANSELECEFPTASSLVHFSSNGVLQPRESR
jgi:hypothetical protein